MTKFLTKHKICFLLLLALMSVLVLFCMFSAENVVLAWTPDSLTGLSIDGQVVNASGDEAALVDAHATAAVDVLAAEAGRGVDAAILGQRLEDFHLRADGDGGQGAGRETHEVSPADFLFK